MLLMAGFFWYYMHNIRNLYDTLLRVEHLSTLTFHAKKSENQFFLFDARNPDFFKTGNSKNISNFKSDINSIRSLIDNLLKEEAIQTNSLKDKLNNIRLSTDKYEKSFVELTGLVSKRGYKDFGLEGNMREAAHNLEKRKDIDKLMILTLRRHEKDFLLRKDLNYVKKLQNEILLGKKELKAESKSEITLISYEKSFNEIVEIEKTIGLSENDGIRGKIIEITSKIEPDVAIIHAELNGYVSFLVNKFQTGIFISMGLLFVIGGISALYFARYISRPIVKLDKIVQTVDAMNNPKSKLALASLEHKKDEFGSLAKNLQKMLERIQINISQIQEQNNQLEIVALEDKNRRWQSEGITKIGDFLRIQHNDVESKCRVVLWEIAKYMNAQIGAIYMREMDELKQEWSMVRMVGYGLDEKTFDKVRFHQEEGLIGAVWKDKKSKLITTIPDNYFKILTGLGECKPNSLLIIPLLADQEVEGVIEIASLKFYDQYEIDFIEKLAEQIAFTLALTKINEINKKLITTMKQKRFTPPTEKSFDARRAGVIDLQELENERLNYFHFIHPVF